MKQSYVHTRRPYHAAGLLATWVVCACGCQPNQPAGPTPDMSRAVALRTVMGAGATSTADDSKTDQLASGPQPVGWTTLRGSFKVEGQLPARVRLTVNKDETVCAPGGQAVFSNELLVDDNGGLKNVVVFLASPLPAEEPWTHVSAAPGNSDVVEFDQLACVFTSHVLAMQTSQPLKLLNSDPVGHNAKLDPKSNPPFNQMIPAAGYATYQPKAEEQAPFPVSCSIHNWMKAWIMIRDNSYVAVTGEDGSFEIPYLPAGVDLEFRVWQEKIGFVNDVRVNGTNATWNRGRFIVTLDADESAPTNTMEVALDASLFK